MHSPHPSSPSALLDMQMGGQLLANMLADWLKSSSGILSTAETFDELEKTARAAKRWW